MKIKATDLEVGMYLVLDGDEEVGGLLLDRITSVTRGNGIVRWTSEHGSGYFDESSLVEVE